MTDLNRVPEIVESLTQGPQNKVPLVFGNPHIENLHRSFWGVETRGLTVLRGFGRQDVPGPPNGPLIEPLGSLIVGIWGIIEGSWGV